MLESICFICVGLPGHCCRAPALAELFIHGDLFEPLKEVAEEVTAREENTPTPTPAPNIPVPLIPF